MGRSFYGDIWKHFWLDHSGREYDPERVSERVWEYLKTTGDAAKIDSARIAGQCSPWMRIVAVDPIVVIQIPCQHKRFANSRVLLSHGTRSAQELSLGQTDGDFYFDEPMEWFSTDLKKGPTKISFSAEGVAEISLASGKLILTHEGEWCKVARQ
jgi:hypothetical protein